MIKVLHFTSWYPNRLSIQEGDFIQRQIQAVSLFTPTELLFVKKDPGMRSTGEESATSYHGNLAETIVYYNPLRTHIPLLDRLISHLRYLRVFKKEFKRRLEKNGRPDLIHVHVALRAGLVALWVKRKYGIPYIITEHWCGYKPEDRKGLYQEASGQRRMTRLLLSQALALVSVSADLEKSLRILVDHPDIRIIPNVVNEDFFYYKPAPPGKKFRFLHVSSMNYFKNAEGIFTAFDKLAQQDDEVELVCVGPLEPALEKWVGQSISEKGRKQILFKGVRAYEEVAVFMRESAVLIVNSLFETFSCVGAEALVSGLPVISTPVGVLPELITGENGLLVNDQAGLYEAMQKMRGNSVYDYNRPAIAFQFKGRFSYQTVGKQLVALYASFFSRNAG